MNKELLYKVIGRFVPEAKDIDILRELDNDDQRAYLVGFNTDQQTKRVNAVLIENGMSGRYSDEDEAIMELTDGSYGVGWFCSDGSRILPRYDNSKCKYMLPARYGLDSYFMLALVEIR